jgi:hypothetical protein
MPRQFRAVAAVLASVFLLTSNARAEEHDDADAHLFPVAGPDHGKMATEEATPVGEGAVEVEAAYSPTFTNRGTGGFDDSAPGRTHAFSMAVFYGATEHLDVKVGGGFANTMDRTDPAGPTRGQGATDLVLGTRWRFLADAERALDLVLATTVVAPTGQEDAEDALGVTQGYWTLRNALVASKDWGRKTMNAELALTLPVGGGAGDRDGTASANLAIGYAVLPWLQPIAEVNYEAARDVTTQQRLALTAGVNMTSSNGTRLLVGVQQAVWGRYVGQTTTALAAFKLAF